MEVIDQSHDNKYVATGGATLTINYGATLYSASTPAKVKVPQLLRCSAPSPKYTCRVAIEKHMASYFFDGDAGQKCYVLHGMGASGKTQISLGFVHRYFYASRPGERRFSQVFWIEATSSKAINDSLECLAQSIGVGSAAEDALIWLAEHDNDDSNWIMIFNAADDPDLDLTTYFPDCSHGNILITTRNYFAKRYGSGSGSDFNVSELTEAEAVELLLKHARIEEADSPPVKRDATILVQALDCSALSVTQAGDYLYKMQYTLKECTDIILAQPFRLFHEFGQTKQPDRYKYASLHDACLTSYSELNQQTMTLLKLSACMNQTGIEQEILQNMCSGLLVYERRYTPLFTEEERSAIEALKNFREGLIVDGRWDVPKFRSCVRQLQSRSLVSFDPDKATFFINPLMLKWVQELCNADTRIQWWQYTVILLSCSVTPNESGRADINFLEKLAPHLDQAMKNTSVEFGGCLNEIGFVHQCLGRRNEEIDFKRGYKETCAVRLGEEHHETLAAIEALAATYSTQKRYEEAARLGLQAVEGRKKVLGDNHLDTLFSMHNLAWTYYSHGFLKEAANFARQAVQGRKRQLGDDHLDSLASMHLLAVICHSEGKYDEAITFGLQAAEGRKQLLGENHLDTFTSVHSLALIHHSQGHYDEAARLTLQAVEGRKKSLGENNLDTLASIHSLASIYHSQGRYAEAARFALQAVEGRKGLLGEDHLDTIDSIHTLAWTYHYQNLNDEAAKLCLQAVEGRKRHLGTDHLDTLQSIHNLALIYQWQGQVDEAASLGLQAVDGRRKILGGDHVDTLSSISLLASIYRWQERYDEAAQLSLEVVKSRKRCLRHDDPDTLDAMSDLADILVDQGNLGEARGLVRQIGSTYEKRWGIDHWGVQKAVEVLERIKKQQRALDS